MSYFRIIAISVLGLFLAGCETTSVPDPDPVDTSYGESSDGANTAGAGTDGLGEGEYFDTQEAIGTVIYFDFDSSSVRAQDQDLVAAHAIQLSGNSSGSVRLEGHADERGSREYNIGLGERRAQAVRQLLMIQGVNASQIQTVSFGEERPESMGSSENDYAQNRRVEIRYTN